jgi:hypothetical protein
MDQFGVKEVTPEIVGRLLGCGSTDIMFFISTSFIRRFIKTPEISARFNLDPNKTRDIEYRTIHRYICDYYRSALNISGSMVAPFSIKKGANIYGLILATTHRRGMEKFLKVCWDLDPSTGEANYNIDADPAWSGEKFLFQEMSTITKIDCFKQSIQEALRNGTMNNVELYRFCLEQGFCASEANKALRSLQDTHTILVNDIVTGTPARKGSFYLIDPSKRITIGLRKR